MSVCPSSEEEPSPLNNALNEIRILREASEASRKNYEAIVKRIKELEKYIAQADGKKPRGDSDQP